MTTFIIENEFEYLRLVSALKELEIEYTEKVNHDTSFPVLDTVGCFAEIYVEDEFADLVKAIDTKP